MSSVAPLAGEASDAPVLREVTLKGGSLNRTAVVEFADGRRVVRKSINRHQEREYGWVRWCSQMKRLQRYAALFPDLFPSVSAIGATAEMAYLDIEYFETATDLKRFLTEADPGDQAVERAHRALWEAMDRMHCFALPASPGALALYYHEEVEQKLQDAMVDPEFEAFVRHDRLTVNGQPCTSLARNLGWFAERFRSAAVARECFTHGNVTLENVLYLPDRDRVIFIDPYDENIVDCRECEYSQVLQCSHAHYGFINDRQVRIDGAAVSFEQPIPRALVAFDALFGAELASRLGRDEIMLVRLFEISQFVRMLPFKVRGGDCEKAKYFYALASQMLQGLKDD